MLRWVLSLLLAVAPAAAWAQPARAPAAAPAALAVTGKAEAEVNAAERQATALAEQHRQLRARLEGEVAAIDRLKQGPRGWRTKSQLEERLSDANETRKQLEDVERRLAASHRRGDQARAQLVRAIDAELAAGAVEPRAKRLRAIRAQAVPKSEVRRIVLPDTELDPRLDPEELDEQIRAIAQGEDALVRQLRGLDEHAKELQRVDDLRRQHQRTIELDKRDDNSPRRGGSSSSTGVAVLDSAGGFHERGPMGMIEADVQIVLLEVIDPAILDGVAKAHVNGDPGKRAAAVRQARDAVGAKLDQLRKKRLEIQKLAKQRRGI